MEQEHDSIPTLMVNAPRIKRRQITVRLTPQNEELIKTASTIQGIRPSYFIENAAVINAHKIIRESSPTPPLAPLSSKIMDTELREAEHDVLAAAVKPKNALFNVVVGALITIGAILCFLAILFYLFDKFPAK